MAAESGRRTGEARRSFQHAGKVNLLGSDLRKIQGAPEVSGRSPVILQAPIQFTHDRMEQIMRFEPVALGHPGKRLQAGLGPMEIRHGNGAIQGNDGRGA